MHNPPFSGSSSPARCHRSRPCFGVSGNTTATRESPWFFEPPVRSRPGLGRKSAKVAPCGGLVGDELGARGQGWAHRCWDSRWHRCPTNRPHPCSEGDARKRGGTGENDVDSKAKKHASSSGSVGPRRLGAPAHEVAAHATPPAAAADHSTPRAHHGVGWEQPLPTSERAQGGSVRRRAVNNTAPAVGRPQ